MGFECGFETVGNATIILHDGAPLLASDPWITGPAYFGSWGLSHQIPAEQMEAIQQCEYVWISHGHPDHLSGDSLKLLANKKVLVPELNMGQLRTLVRAKYLIDAQGFNKVKGRPFAVQELVAEIRRQLGLSTNGQPRETAAAVALAGAADDAG